MKRLKWVVVLTFLLTLFSVRGIYAATWVESLERWTLGRLAPIETALSHWNPIGHLFDNVEEAIPGLTIKGFIENETGIILSNKRDNFSGVPPRRPTRDYTFKKIEWLNELELRYRPQQNWELVTIFDFLYDSAFDWDNEFRRDFRNGANLQEWRNYKNDRILRELYLDLYFRNADIRIGKQQVVWGKVDGRKVMDIINPEDLREFLDPSMDDWEFSRLPLWMVNLKYWWSDYSIQAIWIPDFTETINEINAANSPWEFNITPNLRSPWNIADPRMRIFNPLGVRFAPDTIATWALGRNRPSGLGDDQGGTNEWAFRFSFIKKGFHVDLSYFNSWSDTPTFMRRRFIAPPVRRAAISRATGIPAARLPLIPLFILEPTHTRQHQIGINMDKSIFAFDRQVTFKIENLITLNKYLGVREKFGVPPELGGNPRLAGFATGPGLVKKKDVGLLSFAIESYVRTDWFFAFFTLVDYILPGLYEGNLSRLPTDKFTRAKRYAFSGALSVRKMTYNDRITIGFLHLQDYSFGGHTTRLTFDFALSDFLTLSIGGRSFDGPSRTLFGQMRQNDEMEFGIKYEF